MITTTGAVNNCQMIKGVPHMNEAILKAVSSWRFQPVIYQGKPTNVSYTLNVRLKLQ